MLVLVYLFIFFLTFFISWYGCWLLKDYVNILSKKKNDYVNISYGARRTTKLDVMNYYTVYGGRLMTFLSRIYSRGMHLKKYILAECFFFFKIKNYVWYYTETLLKSNYICLVMNSFKMHYWPIFQEILLDGYSQYFWKWTYKFTCIYLNTKYI